MTNFTAATNDQSILSKASAVKVGYWKDDLLMDLVPKVKKSRRPPLIHMGYWLRHKSVARVYDTFVQSLPKGAAFNVINLGAGFDTFTLHACSNDRKSRGENGASGHFIDIDFDSVVEEKKQLIQQAKNIPEEVATDSKSGYRLFGQDISDVNVLQQYMENECVDIKLPTFFLSEVVMPYMSDKDSQALKEWISSAFPQGVLCFFEPIAFGCDDVSDPFGDAMLNHYKNSVKSPLHTTERYPGVTKQRKRFMQGGFDNVALMLGCEVLDSWIPRDELLQVGLVEPFDEFEVWRVYLRHCMIGFACTKHDGGLFHAMLSCLDQCGSARMIANDANNTEVDSENANPNLCGQNIDKGSQRSSSADSAFGRCGSESLSWMLVKRAGACAAVSCNGEYLFNVGGVQVGGLRLENSAVYNLNGSRDHQEFPCSHKHLVYSTAVTLKQPNGILVFGGRSSPKRASNSVTFISADLASLGNEIVMYAGDDADQDGPPKRYRHSANHIMIGGDEHMIVFGGRDSDGTPLNDVWIFSPTKAVWQQLNSSGSGPCHRHSHASEVNKGVLYVYGGMDAESQVLGDLWMFTPEICEWKKVAALTPIFGHRMISIDKDFVFGDRTWAIVGGVRRDGSASQKPFIIRKVPDPPSPDQMEVCDIDSAFVGDMSSFHHDWFSFGAAICAHTPTSDAVDETSIYCSGGGGGLFSFGHCFNSNVSKVSIELRPKIA